MTDCCDADATARSPGTHLPSAVLPLILRALIFGILVCFRERRISLDTSHAELHSRADRLDILVFVVIELEDLRKAVNGCVRSRFLLFFLAFKRS